MNNMLKKFFFLIVLFSSINSALACNCGCANCGTAQEAPKANIKEEKLFCEAPKDWLLAHKLNERIVYDATNNDSCPHGCNGGIKK